MNLTCKAKRLIESTKIDAIPLSMGPYKGLIWKEVPSYSDILEP